MIKAVTFDLDGVYFINGKSNFIKSLGELGVSEDEAKRVFLKSDKMNYEYKEGKIDDNEYWSWAIDEWNLDIGVDEVIDLLIQGYEVDNNVVETVRKVKSQGIKTCICTNNFPARINGLHERFGFLDDYDVKVVSYEVGKTKPSLEIFNRLISDSGVKPEELVMADDHETNIEVAKSVGINAFFYESFDKFLEDLRGLGVEI